MKQAPIELPVEWTDVVIRSVAIAIVGSPTNPHRVARRGQGEVSLNHATRLAVPRPRRIVQIAA